MMDDDLFANLRFFSHFAISYPAKSEKISEQMQLFAKSVTKTKIFLNFSVSFASKC
jgi:hypothetical protein